MTKEYCTLRGGCGVWPRKEGSVQANTSSGTSVFVALLMAAHRNIQISVFQIVGLGAMRNDILVSLVESIKPRVWRLRPTPV